LVELYKKCSIAFFIAGIGFLVMPVVGLLIDIADFFSVDIREIIDGERKSENRARLKLSVFR